MKKGFSNFMTSIDTALKTNTGADDASDTFSIQSDISSDSENYIMVLADDKTADCMDVMFRLVTLRNFCCSELGSATIPRTTTNLRVISLTPF